MKTEYLCSSAYRLDQLVYKGPGVGFPAAKDSSEDASVVRLVYSISENALLKARGNFQPSDSTRKVREEQVELARATIERLDLRWPTKTDLICMLNAEEQVWQQLTGAA